MNCGPTPCVGRPPASLGILAQASGKNWILAASVLGSSMEFIDGTVVNVALPRIQSSFTATGTQVTWVVVAYALFLSSLLLTGGALGDRFGLRETFLAGIVIFACASVWCGLAPSLKQLLMARCLQGAGGALLVPNSLALLSASFSGAERGRAIGTWSGFASMMTALGPVLGGWMVQHGSWRWVFFLNIPIALTAVWITLAKTDRVTSSVKSGKLDWLGAFLGTVGLGLLTFSLMEWQTGQAYTHLASVARFPWDLCVRGDQSCGPDNAGRSFPKLDVHRFQSCNVLSLRGIGWNALLPSSEPYPDTGLFADAGRRGYAPRGCHPVCSLALGRGSDWAIWSQSYRLSSAR